MPLQILEIVPTLHSTYMRLANYGQRMYCPIENINEMQTLILKLYEFRGLLFKKDSPRFFGWNRNMFVTQGCVQSFWTLILIMFIQDFNQLFFESINPVIKLCRLIWTMRGNIKRNEWIKVSNLHTEKQLVVLLLTRLGGWMGAWWLDFEGKLRPAVAGAWAELDNQWIK